MLSIQTNVSSLVAQENLGVNNAFQGKTIQRLTSGYRINASADDAAGLAVANKFRSDVAELTQGVNNANDGLSQLQIVDGGLTNISNILNRLKTLATASSSTTFTGNRSTLNTEYQSLLSEIDRQATNINMNTGGTSESQWKIYIGGASSANSNAMVSVNLTNSAADITGLNLKGTNVIGGGTGFANNVVNMNDTQALFNQGADTKNEIYTINYVDASGQAQVANATVTAAVAGYSGTAYITALNNAIHTTLGITNVSAQIGGDGTLQFSGTGAFTVQYAATNSPTGPVVAGAQGGPAAASTLTNAGNYNISAAFTGFADVGDVAATTHETAIFSTGGTNYAVNLTADTTSTDYAPDLAHAMLAINRQLAGSGIQAVLDTGGKISFQSSNAFSVDVTTFVAGDGGANGGSNAGSLFQAATGAPAGGVTAADASKSATGNALTAVDAVSSAVAILGQVQGKVGAGENQLAYAISLAQSQITNFKSAESQIRDTDVAAEAANLSKAQVLQQASIAAMAQANSAPQQVLTLLRG